MRKWWVLLAGLRLLEAGVVPDRYIVELSGEPAAAHVARSAAGARFRSAAARDQRARVQAAQRAVRPRVEHLGAVVLGSVDTVANALFVRVPDARAAELSQVPGVVHVRPVRQFHLVLDHALPLHKIPDVWNLVGVDQAGIGIKIAMIDTGIDISHPGLQDSSLPVPEGFPLVNAESDKAFTNQKVIVARSYASMFGTPDPDPSARDQQGHGTAAAMAAAGVRNTGPLAVITGAAPKAYLGSYKVFGSPGSNDGAPEDAILKALEDAVNDGMDVINLSLGTDLATRPADDPIVQAVEQAVAAGVIVVVAAGNNGPDPGTVSSPATAPSAIAVGASSNDRTFVTQGVTVGDTGPYAAIPGGAPAPAKPITGALVDVSALHDDGMACSPLPPASLTGSIAFILRGVCTFEEKLSSAQAAGAVGALVYSDQSRPDAIEMDTGDSTLPAEMVSYPDGLAIKALLTGTLQATLRFDVGPVSINPDRLADFSARGPNTDLSIKPDLVAVGASVYTAAQKTNALGSVYSPDGYVLISGTSFSAPLVSGAAALLESARPGLTAVQYRSLLINSAAPVSLDGISAARVQQAGAGLLDASAAVRSTLAVAPTALNFGIGGPDAQLVQSLTLLNVGPYYEQFQLGVVPRENGPAPALPVSMVRLAPSSSVTLNLAFNGTSLLPGQYEGFVTIQGTISGVETRLPYWFGVSSGTAQYITSLYTEPDSLAGDTVSNGIIFRLSDPSGIPLVSVEPVASVISGGGEIVRTRTLDGASPGVFGVTVTLGKSPGPNVFRIQAGALTKDFTLNAN